MRMAKTKHEHEASQERSDTHGITIRNTAHGGKLKGFERLGFDDLIEIKNR